MDRWLTWRQRAARRFDDDSGAIFPMIALVLVVLLTAGALAVDLGMQRVVARDMQATVDLIALDMARELDGRTKGEVETHWNLGPLQASISRNDDHLGTLDYVTAEAGRIDPLTGDFISITDGEEADAVRVEARAVADFLFADAVGIASEGGATRTAVARAEQSACFRVGSFALGLDSGSSSLLNPILGDLLNTSAVSYEGLADATVTLGDLGIELGLGDTTQLAGADVTLDDLYLAAADVLQQQGDIASANVLQSVAAGVGMLQISLGDLLALDGGGRSALATQVNVLDLVAGSAFLANGSNAIAIPDLGVSIPGITGLSASLTVIQGPIMACNDQVAETSQVELTLTGDIVSLPGIASTAMSVQVNLANADARLIDIDCANNPPTSITVQLFNKSLASTSLATSVDVSVLGIGLVTVDITASTQGPPGIDQVTIATTPADFGDDGLTDPVPTGSGSLALAPLSIAANATVAGLPVDALLVPLLNPILSALNGVVGGLDAALVNDIAPALGMTLAGADVWGIEAPTCINPTLHQ